LQIGGYSGTAVQLTGVQNATLHYLDVSATGGFNPVGVQVSSSSDNVTITNVNASGTSYGILVQNSANPTIRNNTLHNSGTNGGAAALYLSSVTGLTTGAVSGNTFN